MKTPKHCDSGRKAKANLGSSLDLLSVKSGRKRRALSQEERENLILMLAHKTSEQAFDIDRLAPEGSFVQAVKRHFLKTDISYAMPIFQVIMIAASWLTQRGAYVDISGVGRIRPTLWTIGLAESGSSKTLAADRLSRILAHGVDGYPIKRLPMVSTDAQWIIDLSENNGGYWWQDEVGKFIREMNTSTKLARLKPWMLEAYSSAPIGNRLKGEEHKLVIDDPHFTYHGMTVLSTWSHDVNATTMMDGWCQRMNYYLAPARSDTSMFEHFLYFEGAEVEAREEELRRDWQALCAQPGADGAYCLSKQASRYLATWWKGLQRSWGDFALPASFLRRIAFSVLRYLVVIQFLLGKSRFPIDVETASVATAYAEYHMESALLLVQSYDQAAAQHVQRVMALRSGMIVDGIQPTVRDISRRLSKTARSVISTPILKEILATIEKAPKPEDPGFAAALEGEKKAEAIVADYAKEAARLKLNERKRNERRMREVRKHHAAKLPVVTHSNIVELHNPQQRQPTVTPFRSCDLAVS